MKTMIRTTTVIAVTAALGLTLSACGESEAQQRKEKQNSVTLKDSLEIANLKEKLERENDPNAIRYIYIFANGTEKATPVGYYVAKGKVSSSGSQLAHEQEIVDACSSSYCPEVVDSAQDDGTYGAGDPGIFFFTSEGVMVETSLDYLSMDAPMSIDVPRLSGKD